MPMKGSSSPRWYSSLAARKAGRQERRLRHRGTKGSCGDADVVPTRVRCHRLQADDRRVRDGERRRAGGFDAIAQVENAAAASSKSS